MPRRQAQVHSTYPGGNESQEGRKWAIPLKRGSRTAFES